MSPPTKCTEWKLFLSWKGIHSFTCKGAYCARPCAEIWEPGRHQPRQDKRPPCSTCLASSPTVCLWLHSSSPSRAPHLQAMRTVLWALNCSRLTTMTTSVKMSRLRRRLRLRRTSLAWRVNWIQLSAGEAILSSPETKQTKKKRIKILLVLKKLFAVDQK